MELCPYDTTQFTGNHTHVPTQSLISARYCFTKRWEEVPSECTNSRK